MTTNSNSLTPSLQTGHILVFDSGLGGTTILTELQHALPHCSYSYVMDNEAFPYGNQTDDFLIARSTRLFEQLFRVENPDLVVIACNTASTLFLDKLRISYPNIPFIGVVPAIKPAARLTQTGTIALLATPATVHRPYIDQLKESYAKNCQLVRFGHADLALIAEQKMRGNAIDMALLQQIIAQLKQHPHANEIDVFVLGCTHFPAIKQELAQLWGQSALWIDSGCAIAKRAQQLLTTTYINHVPTLWLTSDVQKQALQRAFAVFSIDSCRILEL